MGDQPGGGCCLWLLRFFSFLLWGAGAFTGFAGVSLVFTYKHYQYFFHDYHISLPGAVATAAIVAFFIAGIVGLCIPTKDSRCQQGAFMYFLVVLFCLEATAAVLGFLYRNRIEYELNSVEGIFHRYNGSSTDHGSSEVDHLQKRLGCCGVHNYTDWDDIPWKARIWNSSVPESCCLKSFSNCTGDLVHPEYLYQMGCQTKLHQKLAQYLKYITWGAIGSIFVELLAAVCDCVLMGRQSLRDYRILDSEVFS